LFVFEKNFQDFFFSNIFLKKNAFILFKERNQFSLKDFSQVALLKYSRNQIYPNIYLSGNPSDFKANNFQVLYLAINNFISHFINSDYFPHINYVAKP